MKIFFRKIGNTPLPVEYRSGSLYLKGIIRKNDRHTAKMESCITGEIVLSCDRCGKEFSENLDYMMNLYFSDVVLTNPDDLDAIECLDGVIDISEIIESEINSYKLMYHYCSECINNDTEVNIEY